MISKEISMEQGLAAMSAGVTNTYGSGEGQSTKHYYAGTMNNNKKLTKKKKDK